MSKYRDLSCEMGPLFPACGPAPKIPMYSFDRAAWIFWQAVADQLQDQGKTEAEAIEWMQSREARYALDSLSPLLQVAGRRLAQEYVK